MSQIRLVGPPLNECEKILLVSNSAQTSLCTVKLQHSTVGTRRNTYFLVEGNFKINKPQKYSKMNINIYPIYLKKNVSQGPGTQLIRVPKGRGSVTSDGSLLIKE